MGKIDEGSPLYIALQNHLIIVREKILTRADIIASEAKEDINIIHMADAINEYAPGKQISQLSELPLKKGWLEGFFGYVPPVACLSAILAFAFAALGLWALLGSSAVESALGKQSSGFLDIAKIFAGAIVGSATAAVASGARGK